MANSSSSLPPPQQGGYYVPQQGYYPPQQAPYYPQQPYQQHHHNRGHPHLSHELLAGAAAFAAMKAYEHHMAQKGKPVSHRHAKELIAVLLAVELDRLVETHRGNPMFDRGRIHEMALMQAHGGLIGGHHYHHGW